MLDMRDCPRMALFQTVGIGKFFVAQNFSTSSGANVSIYLRRLAELIGQLELQVKRMHNEGIRRCRFLSDRACHATD